MITALRVDDRLIHGQIAMVWCKEFGTDRIVVANDNATIDEITKVSLQMATPTGKKLLIRTVDDAIKLFNDPRAIDKDMFVLTNCIRDALRIVKACPNLVKSVNVANVGRFDTTPSAEKTIISSTIIVNQDEMSAIRELAEQDLPTYQQVIPSDSKKPLKEIMKHH